MELKVSGLNFSYNKGKSVLQDINFNVAAGEVLGILGTNGTGKTTLLKCILSILRPGKGSIVFGNQDVLSLKKSEIAKLIAYVPQYANNISPVTVIDFVMQGRVPYTGFNFSKKDEQLVLKILKQFDLEEYAFRHVNEMSGGERQRVLIARAMAQMPKIIILDEPTSSLDLHNQLFILEIISKMAKDKQLAIIMTIHDLNLASMFCDKILMMKEGLVFAHGKTDEIVTEANIKAVYNVNTVVSEVPEGKNVRLLRH